MPQPAHAPELRARTSAGASAGALTGRLVGQEKRWCSAASTTACEAATMIAVWPAARCRRPGLSDTPRPRMPALAKPYRAWPRSCICAPFHQVITL